jgi:menaquinone-dependent protoporphyrinogen oxidase
MSGSVLLGYATSYGSTQEVAEAVAGTLLEGGLAVDIQPVREVRTLDAYSAVVLGAPLIMYRWHKDARRFLSRHRKALTERPLAVFALGPVQDPHNEEEWQNSRDQLENALAQFPWLKPVALELFGGEFDPAKLRWPMSWFASKEPASDIRDWKAIRAWAAGLEPLLTAQPAEG